MTSGNFSRAAEQHNVELGLRVDDAALADSVVRQMRSLEERVYVPSVAADLALSRC